MIKVAVLLMLLLSVFGSGVSALEAQSTYQITSATYGTTGLASVPAGVNGATLTLSGMLPSASTPLFACFYTGSGSTTGFALSAPNSDGTEPLNVPASTIQSIPQANFTAANHYSITAKVYFNSTDGTCDGTFDANLTNQYPVQVVAPNLGAYTGPVSIPQTNLPVSYQSAPIGLVLPAGGFLPSTSATGQTTVTFGSFGEVPIANPASATSSVYIAVPPSFSSSPVGTTASLRICNTLAGVSAPVCTTPTPAITITVTGLANSAGTITATPNPVLASGKTILAAQFKKGANAGTAVNLGAPSGPVNFLADGTTLPAAPLILDTTATFATQTSSVATPAAAKPVITPAAGSFTSAQTIAISDATPGAAVYYTMDGTPPTAASTLYTVPFILSTSQTISAIATGAGFLDSAVASAAYTVTIRPATQLAFQVPPVNSAANSPITPAVKVAVEDSTGAVVTSSSAAVTIALRSNPGEATLGGTLTVNAVNGIATFSDLSLNQVNPRGTSYTLYASSGTLTGIESAGFNITPPTITMTLLPTGPTTPGLVGVNSTLNGSFTLGVAAPTGGLVVNLSSGTPANVTISPATVTVAAGQTTGAFTYTGVHMGSSTLSASATGYQTGTSVATATMSQVSLTLNQPVAPGQTQSLALSLPTAAPPGGTTVTFTSANPNIATVTSSISVPAGQFTAATNPQVTGVLIGTTSVTASAPGYAPVTLPINVTVTASFNPVTTNINLITSTNTLLQISAPAPAGGIKFNLASSDPTKATVPASVTVIQGGTNVKVPITGVADGTVTIAATSAGITEADGTVNVNSQIVGRNFVTGYDLENYDYFYLPVSPSTPTTVTITSNDPTVALISTSQNTVGQATVTFTGVTTSTIGYLYIQGKKVGTTTLTISAPGYTSGTETVTVDNTGFAYYGAPNIQTTTYATPSTATVYPVPLSADGSIYGFFSWIINPGSAALSIPIISSATSIGTVTSPIVFHALDGSQSFTFTPVGAGTSNLSIGAPPTGFVVPMLSSSPQYQQITATVTTPAIVAPSATTGVHLQPGAVGIYLPVAPPTSVYPNGVTVTVTMTASPAGTPLAATISKTNTVAGTTTVTFTNVTTTNVGYIYVQGQSAGTATISVSASTGYTSGTNTVTVQPSGFAYNYGNNTVNTTSFSGTNTLTVYPFLLDTNSAISGYAGTYYLNPGIGPLTVPLTNSNNSVGTISANSVVFNTNDNYQQFTFQPVSAGTTNITIGAVTGFTTPTTYTQATATVTAPAISISAPGTGVHFQQPMGISLPVAPPTSAYPSGDTVTVTSSAPGIVILSKDNVTVGTATLTFAHVTSSSFPNIYVQGQGAGTATITMSAPGYVSGSTPITVLNSGFGFFPGNGTFTTSTFSGAYPLTIYSLLFDSNNNFAGDGLALSPGVGPVTVAITDSNASVGTLSSNALVFNTNDTSHQITFQPVAAGTANLTITQPTGFTAPTATSAAGVATVTAPGISVSDSNTGVGLETSVGISLLAPPPNPVTVTVTSNGPLISLLSKDATTIGSTSLTFTVGTGNTNVGTIYVQGESLGATTLKVTASGYTDGNANITVYNAGFSFYYNNSSAFTTSIGASPTQLDVYPVLLTAGTLTPVTYSNLYVSPSAGTVNVPVTNSNPSVGTVVSPLSFAPGSTQTYIQFTPVSSGTSTINIGTPSGFSVPTDYTTSTATVQ